MIRAAIYARVSSAAQRDAQTIESQLHVLRPFVASRGWLLAGEYIDDGRSAKTGKLEKRDGFARLLADVGAGLVDVLVVVDVDRLTRTSDAIERAAILGPFQRAGVRIVTPAGGELDLDSFIGGLYVELQARFAAEENRKRAERIKAGKLRAIAEGRKPAGPTPYGLAYSRAEGKWSIDAPRAEIVREIFRRVAAGESCVVIAEDLARRGELAPRTGWSRAAVYRIVRKRSSCGEWSADKARGAVIAVPAIVTEDEWQAAQRALLRHRKRGLVRTKHVYLLEGLARCAACGGRIGIRSATRNGSSGYINPAAYVCQVRKLERGCKAPIVRCADLDARVWERLCEELLQPDIIEALAAVGRQRAGDAHDWNRDAETHRAHLARLQTVEVKLMERFRRGAISEEGLDVELAALGRERKFVRDQLAAAERAVESIESARARQKAAAVAVAALRSALPGATPEQRRALLRELARDGGVVIANGRARLDLRLVRAAAPVAAPRPAIALADQAGSRRQHGAISEITLRLRLVA